MHLSKKHGYSINEIKNDGFKIYSKIPMIPKGNSGYFMANSLGQGVVEFSKIFRKLKPDINLILGDRDEAFASALAASHMNILNAHIHGGDRTMAGITASCNHSDKIKPKTDSKHIKCSD
jgi:UDP-N-acetylglucosamine 2-epimerase